MNFFRLVVVLVVSAVVASLVALASAGDAASCDEQWRGSGMGTNYSFFGGCKVTLKDGRVVPADRVRIIEGGML